ncbi:MAG: hypothetical protein EX272_07795 [Chromatiales bacterium]|nr:MAG: hypothetical protein EX272_07795 [Chromatiales bacterium]
MKKLLAAGVCLLLVSGPSVADHAWSDYHWARTTSSFDLVFVNSTTVGWDSYVSQAVSDWSASAVLNMVEDPSGSESRQVRRRCNGSDGQVRVCNLAYGNTGWLGIAGISLDANGHITTGYTKLNDTYFDQAYYDTPAWRLSVTCQELGHNVGLGHQDEDFNNQSLFSCMDYQDPPFEFPNQHDYDQLETIYGHTDSYDSYTGGGDSGGGGSCNAPPGKGCNKAGIGSDNANNGWGISLGRRGQQETFMRIDPDGTRHLVHVTWAIGF